MPQAREDPSGDVHLLLRGRSGFRPLRRKGRSQQHEIVPVDDFVASTPAEYRLDLIRAVPDDVLGIGTRISGQPARQRHPIGSGDDDGVAPLKGAAHSAYTGRQQ